MRIYIYLFPPFRSVFEKKISFIVSEGRQMPEDWVKSGAEEEVKTTQPNVSNDLMSVKRRFKKHSE